MVDEKILRDMELRAIELEAEAQRYRQAIAVLRGSDAGADLVLSDGTPVQVKRFTISRKRKSGPNSTMSMIRTVLGHEVGRAYEISDLTQAMLDGGWETESTNPVNTVRTALMRMVERGEVTRLGSGNYLMTPGIRQMRTDADDDD